MTLHPDDNDVDIDPVVKVTDARIRREAIRQLDSVDIEDDESRMEPLPGVDLTELFPLADGHESIAAPGHGTS